MNESNSKSQHTPGPWHNDGYRIYAPTADTDKRNGRIIVEYKHVEDFNEADDHLIAAAPELLEALENVMKSHAMSFYVNQPSEERPAWVVEALAVISKAKGE